MSESYEWLSEFLRLCAKTEFSEDIKSCHEAADLLKRQYVPGFRHRYSKIAAVIRSDSFKEYMSDELEIIHANLRYIEEQIDSFGFTEKQKESYEKLMDHLELELDRAVNIDERLSQLEYSMRQSSNHLQASLMIIANRQKDDPALQQAFKKVDQLYSALQETAAKSEDSQERLAQAEQIAAELQNKMTILEDSLTIMDNKEKELDQKTDSLSSKIEAFNAQSITVLSIFTAIVFAFTGGFTMLGSAFSNLSGITRNEAILLIALVLIVGLVLTDIIYVLLKSIMRIHAGTFKDNQVSWKDWFKRPVIVINGAVIAVVVILLLCNFSCVTPYFNGAEPTPSATVFPVQIVTSIPTAMPTPAETSTASPTPTEAPTATPTPTEAPTATPMPSELPVATPNPLQ